MEAEEDPGGNGLSRKALENLTKTVPAIVYIAEMGERGRWHYISPQVTEVLGYQPDEWCSDVSLYYRSIHPDDFASVIVDEDRNPTSTQIMPPVEYRMRTRDDRWVWVYECARLVVDPDGGQPLWHGVISDITALKEAEASAARRAEQQTLTARLGAGLLNVGDQQGMFELTVKILLGLESIIQAEIWEQTAGGLVQLRYRSGYEGPPLAYRFDADRYPGSELVHGNTVVINDWNTEERMGLYSADRNPEVLSTIIVPIPGTDRPFGFLSMSASSPNRFSSHEEDFLTAATSLLGSTIDRNRVELSLRYRLLHDSLTELPNRDLFSGRLEQGMEKSKSARLPMAALFLDVDHFKLINDGIGHYVGDQTLKEVGHRLRAGLPDKDTVARFGGDEFGIVLTSVDSANEALACAEKLLELLSDPIGFEGREIVVAASIGVAFFDPRTEPDKEASLLLREANAAMHEAKVLGRAQVRLFDQPLRNSSLNRLDIESGLRTAIEGEELTIHFQPIVALPDHRLIGFESLVRWQHPERGLIEPAEFIPVAEESGLISRIDSWVLEAAAQQIAEWRPIIPAESAFALSVNASARQLSLGGLPERIASVLERHQVPPELLGIEITEGALVSGSSAIGEVLDEIRALGVRLALDDFGTGFSSLSHLGMYPFDCIKIDRTFIEQLSSGEPAGPAITDAILRIGEALSMNVIAEGVSTPIELELVQQLGCRLVQGYLISRPVTAAAATAMLRKRFIPIQSTAA